MAVTLGKLQFVFLFILNHSFCSAEVYSSANSMQAAFQIEREIVNILEKYAQKLDQKLKTINEYMQGFQEAMNERQFASDEDEFLSRISGNPIHAYKLMKRFTVDWKKMEDDLSKDDWTDTEFILRKKRLGAVMPKEEDLHAAAKALIRLQEVYDLDISEFVKGHFQYGDKMVQSQAKLTSQDCLYVGKHCFNGGLYSRSLEWFEESWHLASEENNLIVSQDKIKSFLDHAAEEHDKRVLEKKPGGDVFPRPVHEEPPAEQRRKLIQKNRENIMRHINETTWSSVQRFQFKMDEQLFSALCQGKEVRPDAYVAKLKCRLEDRDDPYFLLNPVKVEVLHLDPEILLFHDVTTERERAVVRKLAEPTMIRSQIMGNYAGASEVSYSRTSKTTWIQDSTHPVVRKMSDKVSWYTGLNTYAWTNDAELLQVANYVNAGHYDPHHDYIHREIQPDHMIVGENDAFIGDRIATWMYYMSDVEAGGRTVFPRLGVGTAPVAGSAVFWYNILDNGDADTRTLHGACPVLYGIKWVSNKWIREGAQAFTRPCMTRQKS